MLYLIGSEGYIGSYLQGLIAEDQLIRVGRPRKKYGKRVLTSLPKQVPSDSTCILLASLTREKGCEENKTLAYQTNVELVKQVCDLEFDKIIFTSSSILYENSVSAYATEESAVSVSSYYAETKLRAEEIILSSNPNNIVARIAVTVGRSTNMLWHLLVNYIAKCVIEKSCIEIYGPDEFRPYCDVADVSRALLVLNDSVELKGQIVNVGNTALNCTKRELICSLQELIPQLNYRILSEENKRSYKVSFKKMEKNYTPQVTLKETFSNLIYS